MASKEVILTYEGLKKLEEDLQHLKGTRRREIAERIRQALSFGDISENSDYDYVKKEQADVEAEISRKEYMLKNAKVIDENDVSTEIVTIGSVVVILAIEDDEKFEYQIVGSAEANPSKSKISNESPVGSALVGKKKGDIVEIVVPDGIVRYKVLEIHK